MSKGMIDLGKLTRDLKSIENTIKKLEDIATTRALNEILNFERSQITKDISSEYGITQASAKEKILPIKATRNNKNIKLIASSYRANLIKPTQLKKGISHLAFGRRRVKINVKVNGGSLPFLINAKAGGESGGQNIQVPGGNKKVPVFRPEGSKRKVKTLKSSSIPHMMEKLEIGQQRLLASLKRNFPRIYQQQLKKAKYS